MGEHLESGWYKSKKGWASALLAATYFILDHVSRAETAQHIYNFLLSARIWFPKVSPWIAPALFLLALAFFEFDRRKATKRPVHPKIESRSVPVQVARLQSLAEKVSILGHEILLFLKDQGPPPEINTRDDLRPALAVSAKRIPRINDGYMGRFHDRVEKIIYELGEKDVRDYSLNELVNKPVHSEEEIKEMAEKLLSLQSEVDGFKDSDPRVYVEIGEGGDAMFHQTPFILHNRGGGVAHSVSINPLEIHYKNVSFPIIPIIPAGESKQSIPQIESAGTMLKHTINPLLIDQWNAINKLTEETVTSLRITYEDFNKQKFETALDLVFFPIQSILKDKHANDWPKHDWKVFQTRNFEFRKANAHANHT